MVPLLNTPRQHSLSSRTIGSLARRGAAPVAEACRQAALGLPDQDVPPECRMNFDGTNRNRQCVRFRHAAGCFMHISSNKKFELDSSHLRAGQHINDDSATPIGDNPGDNGGAIYVSSTTSNINQSTFVDDGAVLRPPKLDTLTDPADNVVIQLPRGASQCALQCLFWLLP
jgi:hypothetical protein